MNDRKKSRGASSGGFGLPMLLFIIFLILKLTHVIDWKWLWVTSPIWIGVSLGILFFLFIGFILFLALIGLASQSGRVVTGIKGWFKKQDMEEISEE